MKIGIIGIGNIGGALARKLAANGHEVRVANSKGKAAVQAFADEIGATAADVYAAVNGTDAIVMAIPFHAMAQLPRDLFSNVPDHVPVIDTSNYYPGMLSPQIPAVDAGMTESLWVAQQLGRPVTKAFNNILAVSLATLGRPKGAPDRIAIAVAGDDPDGKALVMDLVDQVGFEPVDAGNLGESWRQEPCTPAYCVDFSAEETREGLKNAKRGTARSKLARLPDLWAMLGPSPTHSDIIRMNRKLNTHA